jgi:hypothetical protein
MGASSFQILAGMYLQFTEYNNVHDVLMKHKVTGYISYADDVLLIQGVQSRRILRNTADRAQHSSQTAAVKFRQ